MKRFKLLYLPILVFFLTMILFGFMMLAMMMQFMIRGIASIQRINEVLNTKPVINSGEVKKGKEVGTVEFKNVSFSYPRSEEGERVLQNISDCSSSAFRPDF